MSTDRFKDVDVITAVNVYFDGNVSSRTVEFSDGSQKTLGLMLPGEYEFGTDAAELMEIQSGALEVQLPGSDSWQAIAGGESFNVPGNSRFTVRVSAITDYICSFLK